MNGDTETTVISGFRRASEAQAWARAHNRALAATDTCSNCSLATPNRETFCPEHDVAHHAIHPKLVRGADPTQDVVEDTHVVVLKRG